MAEILPFTDDDAKRFIERYGLTKLGPDHVAPMAEAMTKMAAAGLAVTRVRSKFDPPAAVFRVVPAKPD